MIDIREARLSDIDRLVAIEDAAFESDRISRRSFRRLIGSATCALLVATAVQAEVETGFASTIAAGEAESSPYGEMPAGSSVENDVSGYCLVLLRAGSSVARLYSIAVDGSGGASGVGGALLRAAEQVSLRRGRKALRLEVRETNLRARRLYERNGYRRIGARSDYYADGMMALRYEKVLVSHPGHVDGNAVLAS